MDSEGKKGRTRDGKTRKQTTLVVARGHLHKARGGNKEAGRNGEPSHVGRNGSGRKIGDDCATDKTLET